jgi:hypothetical protein
MPLRGAAGGRAVRLQVAAMLPQCIELASSIIAAGERVVANNARCSYLVARITAMQPLLLKMQAGQATR